MSLGFQCKQFYVRHDRCAMKVSTDSLLLGSWAELPTAAHSQTHYDTELSALDIGCGSGLLALMIAQRANVDRLMIDAVEIDPDAAAQAQDNVQSSPWNTHIKVIQDDVIQWSKQNSSRYHLIVSNPPYFQSHLLSTAKNKQQARHDVALSLVDLFDVATDQLHPRGEFALVLPQNILAKCLNIAEQNKLKLRRCCHVKTTSRKAAKLVLLQFCQRDLLLTDTVTTELIIHDQTGAYSADFKALTRDFYLPF